MHELCGEADSRLESHSFRLVAVTGEKLVPPGLWFVLGLVAEEWKRGAVEDMQDDDLNVGVAGPGSIVSLSAAAVFLVASSGTRIRFSE